MPTPFAVGRVNAYLIEDEPLTLVDAGPNSGTSFDVLQRGVEALGHALEDIGLVVPTHQHKRLRMHERRAEKLHRLISKRPRSAYELAQSLWGNIAATQAYLTLSEVLGHTDLLLDRGQVHETEEGGVVRFEAAA